MTQSRNHHHLLHDPDDHPPNPDTISTSGNSPSPHEPVAQATETAAPSTHLQSCRSSLPTSTRTPRKTGISSKTPASQWAVYYSPSHPLYHGPSQQKHIRASATRIEIKIEIAIENENENEKEKRTALPVQTTTSQPHYCPAKPSCPLSTSTPTQTPTPHPHIHPP